METFSTKYETSRTSNAELELRLLGIVISDVSFPYRGDADSEYISSKLHGEGKSGCNGS